MFRVIVRNFGTTVQEFWKEVPFFGYAQPGYTKRRTAAWLRILLTYISLPVTRGGGGVIINELHTWHPSAAANE
jgi:hypothetical protein